MTIRIIFRVQCDACKGWLALPEGTTPGSDVVPADLVCAPTAEFACNWPSELNAKASARDAGWGSGRLDGWRGFYCPVCLGLDPAGAAQRANRVPDYVPPVKAPSSFAMLLETFAQWMFTPGRGSRQAARMILDRRAHESADLVRSMVIEHPTDQAWASTCTIIADRIDPEVRKT
jgi:hypothetical protein